MGTSASNQERSVAPVADGRLKRVAEACKSAGLPPSLCLTLALGYIASLRLWVWHKLTDVIGSADELEAMVGWSGPPRHLAKALEIGKYVGDFNGVYCATDAVTECPEYVRRRWIRANKESYQKARERATAPGIAESLQDDETVATPQGNGWLFEGAEDVATKPGHDRIVKYWFKRFKELINPSGYVSFPADFKLVKDLLDATNSVSRIERAIDAFLTSKDPICSGYSFRTFYRFFHKFDRPDQAGGASGAKLGSAARIDAGRL